MVAAEEGEEKLVERPMLLFFVVEAFDNGPLALCAKPRNQPGVQNARFTQPTAAIEDQQ